jgi:hypothetical protein
MFKRHELFSRAKSGSLLSPWRIIYPVVGLGLLLAASNVWLVRENGQLRVEVQYYRAFREPRVGLKPPSLRGQGLDGKDVVVSYPSGSATLLLVFSPTCPHCKRNWPVWSRLTRLAKDCRVIYVNAGGATDAAFRLQHDFGSATVVEHPDLQSILDYSLFQAPLTIYVSAKGQIERVWSGEIAPPDVAAAEKIIAATAF